MTALIGAEVLKLRTTRTGVALVGSVVGVVVLISLLVTLAGDPHSEDFNVRDLLGIAGFAQPFAMILGILAVTSEFRHGTITPTLVTTPDRIRVIVAKLAAHLVAGLVLGVVAVGLCTVIVLGGLSARNVSTGLDTGEVVRIAVGQTLATALWAGLGVGLGALIRNQVAAIVSALGWTLLGENLLQLVPTAGDWVQKYGLVGVSNALGDVQSQNTGDVLAQVPGGLLLTAYAAAFLIAGALVLRRQDVTS
jgi:ABC-2 type transport system permease protein